MPVQRIPRYILLLEDLLKNTPDELKEEKDKLNEAYNKIKEIAAFLNDSKRRAETSSKLLNIQNKLLGYDVIVPYYFQN